MSDVYNKTAYGQLLPNYSTIPISLNTVLRMAVGDFNFEEIYDVAPGTEQTPKLSRTRVVLDLFWVYFG